MFNLGMKHSSFDSRVSETLDRESIDFGAASVACLLPKEVHLNEDTRQKEAEMSQPSEVKRASLDNLFTMTRVASDFILELAMVFLEWPSSSPALTAVSKSWRSTLQEPTLYKDIVINLTRMFLPMPHQMVDLCASANQLWNKTSWVLFPWSLAHLAPRMPEGPVLLCCWGWRRSLAGDYQFRNEDDDPMQVFFSATPVPEEINVALCGQQPFALHFGLTNISDDNDLMNYQMNGRLDEGRFYMVEISLYWYQDHLTDIHAGFNGRMRGMQTPETMLWRGTSMSFAIRSHSPGSMIIYDGNNKNQEIARVRRAGTVSSLVRDAIGPTYLYIFVCASDAVTVLPAATELLRRRI